jgi:hypothetical protein
MSIKDDLDLMDKTKFYYDNGSEELRAMIDKCHANHDLEGLRWVLDHATVDDTPNALQGRGIASIQVSRHNWDDVHTNNELTSEDGEQEVELLVSMQDEKDATEEDRYQQDENRT